MIVFSDSNCLNLSLANRLQRQIQNASKNRQSCLASHLPNGSHLLESLSIEKRTGLKRHAFQFIRTMAII
jgi:hypothetical protein